MRAASPQGRSSIVASNRPPSELLEAILASEERIRREIRELRSDLGKAQLERSETQLWPVRSEELAEYHPGVVQLRSQASDSDDRVHVQMLSSLPSTTIPAQLPHAASARSMSESVSAVGATPYGGISQLTDRKALGTATASAKLWRGWPASIQIHPEFAIDDASPDNLGNLHNLAQLAMEHAAKLVNPIGMYEVSATRKRVFSMLRPDSWRHLLFDLLALVVLLFDVIFTPFYLTWQDVVPNSVAVPLLTFTGCFWVVDMLLSFCTGFYTADGRVELRFQPVALQYLRSWFLPDLICVTVDWAYLFPALILGQVSSSGTGKWSRLLRLTKLVRFLRVLGMVRMLKVIHAVNMFMEVEVTEAWQMKLRIFQLVACLLWLGHLTACGWYAVGIGAPKGELGEDWTETLVGLRDLRVFDDLGAGYQYVTCYQWGLAQLTLGTHDIDPINASERLYTVCCNLFGLLLGGTLISVLSTTLIDLKEVNQERAMKMRTLKDFLLQHQVDIGVRMRILRQVQDRIKDRDHMLVLKDVPALQVLSHTLERELRTCLFTPHLLTHSIFRAWTCIGTEALKQLSGDQGVEFMFLLPDDELFSAGKNSAAGYNVMTGHVEYRHDCHVIGMSSNINAMLREDSTDTSEAAAEGLEPGAWLAEATWWCMWVHVGTATATVPSTFLSISAEVVQSAMTNSLSVSALTMEYARLFHQRVVEASGTSLPTDVRVHYTHFSDLIFAMPSDIHIILGMAALERALKGRAHWKLASRSLLLKMEEEIREGRSIVLLDSDDSLQRQVALTLLCLERPGLRGQMEALTEVATFSGGEWQATCRLPGTKQKFGETPGQCLRRFLEDRLWPCRDVLEAASSDFWDFKTAQEVQASAQYGVGTLYNKCSFVVPCSDEAMDKLRDYAFSVDTNYGSLRTMSSNVMGLNLTFARKAGLDVKEDFLQSLDEVKDVYIMGGAEQVAMYAWLDEQTRDFLAQGNKDLLRQWLAAVAAALAVPREQLSTEWWAPKDPSPTRTKEAETASVAALDSPDEHWAMLSC